MQTRLSSKEKGRLLSSLRRLVFKKNRYTKNITKTILGKKGTQFVVYTAPLFS